MRLTCVAVAVAAGFATSAMAQVTVTNVASLTGTIQPGGPRQGVFGNRFFNIEGVNNGSFASYGVARWNLTQARADLDTAFGVGQWQISKIELEVTQDNAAFSLSGPVAVYYSTDDATDIKTLASPLFYPFFDGAISDLPLGNSGAPVLSYSYIAGVTGDLDRYNQDGSTHAGGPVNPAEILTLASDLVQDIKTENLLTLVFVDGDPATAATYRGQEAFSGRVGPNLFITAIASGGGVCYANCDASTAAPVLNANDFNCFLNAFAAGLSYANCDNSTTAPVLNANDFNCFLNAYAAGCS